MAREHPDYRNNLEILNARYPAHDMLSMSEVMQIFGCVDRRTLARHIDDPKLWSNKKISKAAVARYMCGK